MAVPITIGRTAAATRGAALRRRPNGNRTQTTVRMADVYATGQSRFINRPGQDFERTATGQVKRGSGKS